MTNEKTKETEYFEQNFDKEILDEVRKMAEKEKRSVTQQINVIMLVGLLQYKKGGKI
jgi:hypothetical protein